MNAFPASDDVTKPIIGAMRETSLPATISPSHIIDAALANIIDPPPAHQTKPIFGTPADQTLSSPVHVTKPVVLAARKTIEPLPSAQYWSDLRILAETFNDVQKSRIAMGNRLSHAEVNKDELQDIVIVPLAISEKRSGLLMRQMFRKSGYAKFQKETRGVGEHLLARLLGALGDPCVAMPAHWEGKTLIWGERYYRSVSQLWQYCGHGSANRRAKGMTQEEVLALGSPTCKMLVRLIAVACTMQKGKDDAWLRRVYEERREETFEREGWTNGHKHDDALRIVGKEFLRELWLYGSALHKMPNGVCEPGPRISSILGS